MGLSVTAWPDLDSALEHVCRVAATVMQVARVSVWRHNETQECIHSAPRWHNGIAGWDAHVVTKAAHPVYWKALQAARALSVADARRDPVLAEFREGYLIPLGIGALLDSAVRAEQRLLGIVCFEHVGGARAWTDAEQEFAASIADRVGVALLLAEQRQLEAELRETQKMEAIGLLAGGVAHDFNNVLGIIQASAELIRDGVARGQDVSADVQAIEGAAVRAAALTRTLLRIARREAMVRTRFDLNRAVDEFAAVARTIARGDVTLQLALADVPLEVDADRTFLDQVLLNLVSNGVQAMASRGTLTIETARFHGELAPLVLGRALPAGRFSRLTVRDTGPGIPREIQRRIFEPFFTTKGETGTGLGLAVVYGGVRQHGGHVAVESEPGQGAAFHVVLPLVR